MDWWVEGWVDRCMDGGMEGWMDGWRDGGMDGGWMDDGWMDGWMEGWRDGGMEGCMGKWHVLVAQNCSFLSLSFLSVPLPSTTQMASGFPSVPGFTSISMLHPSPICCSCPPHLAQARTPEQAPKPAPALLSPTPCLRSPCACTFHFCVKCTKTDGKQVSGPRR